MNKPDIKAPRYRPPSYKSLSKVNIDSIRERLGLTLTNKEIEKIVETCNSNYVKECIANRDGIELPEYLGYIMIGTCKPKIGNNTNYYSAIEHEKILEHSNLHTDGYLAKIFYVNKGNKYNFVHSHIWGFEPSRIFKRSVAKSYPENYTIYKHVEPLQRIQRTYTKQKQKEFAIEVSKRKLEDFNELEL